MGHTPEHARIPLTPEQRAMVEAEYPVARLIAAKAAMITPHLRDDFESAAGLALIHAAQGWKGIGGASFRSFAIRRIRGAMLDTLRDSNPAGYRRGEMIRRRPTIISIDTFRAEGDGGKLAKVGDLLASDDDPIGWEIESEDEVRRLASSLPRGYAEPVRLLYLRADCNSMASTGRAVGLCESRISMIHADAIGRLRQSPRAAKFLPEQRPSVGA